MLDQEYTRYERARIIGARALQISAGAPILINNPGEKDPISIAMQEFDKGIIPITVKRTNNGQCAVPKEQHSCSPVGLQHTKKVKGHDDVKFPKEI